MKKAVSLLLTLILTLSLCTPVLAAPDDNEGDVPQQGQQENNGPQWPEGTEQCFFYEDNNEIYYSGTGLSQGRSVTFGQIFKRTHIEGTGDSFTPLTGFTVDSTTKEGLTAEANGNALTISVAGDCEPGESFVILTADNEKYALCVNVHESSGGQGGQDGPPAFVRDAQKFVEGYFEQTEAGWKVKESSNTNDIQGAWNRLNAEAQLCAVQSYRWLLPMFKALNISAPGYYLLSENTAVRVTVPGYLQDVVLLSWNKETNTLTVRFNNGLTADRWKSIYTGGGKRDFAALYYTFIYIGEGQRPDYWTWVDGSEKAIDAVIAEAGTKANYDPNDRGITNGIYVARFQNDGEIMALPGNTSYNSTSREIISWKDKSTDYFTNVIDTTGMSNISFTLDEDAGQSYGQGRNWLNELGTPAGNERIDTYTTAEGVTLTVNNGLVTAQLDGTKLLDLEKVLASYVTVTAPEGATEYRMVGNGTSTEPGAADDAGAKWEVTSMKDWLAKKSGQPFPARFALRPIRSRSRR